jgi:hypothetical protein
LADVAIEPHELTELNPVGMRVLNRDVGGLKAVGHDADRLHLVVGDQQRNLTDLGMPDLPARRTQDTQAHDNQDETEARKIVAVDRAAAARRPGHSTAQPRHRR